MNRTKLNVEIAIEGKVSAGVFCVFSGYVDQLISGQWSDTYITYSELRKHELSSEAYKWLNGFIWGIYSAGLIEHLDRENFLDELMKSGYKSFKGEC